ncbi:glycine betaine ABC transporter substrate-binding protein [Streptomyces sp. TRM68367]|uniref:glycine betaine ABC transporter substrate-binding protein n=1 Tax=Streptomyces sp. TRM68367 TaxID=2758415 RepID=UPI00165CBCAB|nr:glycine betaine ABC transporter substrate-binding protein [Streptomyces sp. TRM68367]MBC9731483.1 glycine betaine ABC transporter substrate-binding protein [Streptomyces sp. TRM68367]
MIRTMRPKNRLAVAAGSAGVLLLLAACSGQTASVGSGSDSKPDSKNVSFAMVDGWDENVATTYLWKELLEERGYKVNVRSLDIASTFTAVANGQVDLYTDAWLPTTHKAYWDRFGSKLEVVSTWYGPAENNLAVPTYMKDVNTIEDLKGKQAEFGNRIVGIEAGAGLMKLTRTSVIPGYGLKDYDLVEGSTPAMLSALESSVKQKKPIVVTLWKPHWAFTKFPIKALKDPKGAFGKPDKAETITSKEFAKNNPKLVKWMNGFKLTSDQLGSLELLIQEKGKGKEQAAAKEWIAKNKSLVDSWLK